MIQFIILAAGILTSFLLAQKNKWQKWGFVVGFCAEPFWFISAWEGKQWGILILCVWYTICFALGIYNHWKREEQNES